MMYPETLEKYKQARPRSSRLQEIIKIRAEISDTEWNGWNWRERRNS